MRRILFCGFFMVAALAEAKQVTDRLVQGLDCKKIDSASIYAKIPYGAYDVVAQMSERNWAFSYLANCWSLARTQRLVYMLARINPRASTGQGDLESILNLMRGSDPFGNVRPSPSAYEPALKNYKVFELDRNPGAGSNIWALLKTGYLEDIENNQVARNFKNEIQHFQFVHFHRPENLKMGLGSWRRTRTENEKSFTLLKSNADQHRLTLVVLRADRNVQHVVLVKSYTVTGDGKYLFRVYDSNFPGSENSFFYNTVTGQFNGDAIMGVFYKRLSLNRPVGLFIVDENEQSKIDRALVDYYQGLCR